MLPFRFVRRFRRAVTPFPATFAPRLDRLDDRITPVTNLDFETQPTTPSSLTFNGPNQIEVGDFNGDGFNDYAAIGFGTTDSTVELGINNQDRSFNTAILTLPNSGSVSSVRAGSNQSHSLAVADLVSADGIGGPDGFADVAVALDTSAPFGGGVVIFRSQGDGTFVAGSVISQIGFFNPGALAAGDLTGDGVPDLFLTRQDSDAGSVPREYTVLVNNGTGGFQSFAVSGKAGTTKLDRPTITDVDGDGFTDVIAVQAGSGQAYVFWGRGDGSFDTPTTVTVAGTVYTVAAPDFDGDGARDLVVSSQNSKTLNVFYQANSFGSPFPGNRNFPPTQQASLTVGGLGIFNPDVTDLAVADFNFDQVDDLVAVNNNFGILNNNQTYPFVNVFLGSPTRNVLPAGGTPLGTNLAPQAVAAADFDRNFLPDILVGGEGFQTDVYQSFFNDTKIGGEVLIVDQSPVYNPFSEAFGSTFYGQPINLSVSVSKFIAVPTGNVEFFANGVSVGSVALDGTGMATLTIDGTRLTAAPYAIQAKYTAGNYADATAAVQHNVRPLDTTTVAVVSDDSPVFGQPVTFTATVGVVRPTDFFGRPFGPTVSVTPGAASPTPIVAFYDNGNLIGSDQVDGNGVATFTAPQLSLGDHPIQAKFLNSVNFTASEAEFLNITVGPAESSTLLTASPRAINFGDTVNLTATVTINEPGVGTPDGSVRFFLGNTVLGEALVGSDGKAVLAVTPTTAGLADYTARYLGNDKVATSVSGPARVRVAATVSTAALSLQGGNSLSDTVPVTVTVTDPQGRAVNTGTVTITATLPDGSVVTVADNLAVVNGAATKNVTPVSYGLGETTFTARFNGTDSITPADATSVTLTVVKATPSVVFTNTAGSASVPLNKDITFTTTLDNVGTLTATPTGTVTFLDNGTPLATVPLDANGRAAFTARLPLGSHTVTAQYSGDALYAAGGFTTPVTVVRAVEGFVASSAGGGSDRIQVYNPDGTFNRTLFAFGPDTQVGVRVSTGDLNGDGIPDFAAGTGPGVQARVRVLDGGTGEPLFEIFPFEDFTGGVFVAIGDANGDLRPDLLITPDQGGGPRVRIFSGNTFGQIADYFGIEDPAFRGGARAAVGDVNADGFGDVIVSAGFSGGPRIAVWDGRGFAAQGQSPRKLFNDFFAFEPTLRNGAYVAAGDLDGDGYADPIFGAGPGGAPRVLAMSGLNLTNTAGANRTLIANFFAGDINSRGGVPVTARNMDTDGLVDIVTGTAGGGNTVSVYAGSLFRTNATPARASQTITVFDDGTNPPGGVFVG